MHIVNKDVLDNVGDRSCRGSHFFVECTVCYFHFYFYLKRMGLLTGRGIAVVLYLGIATTSVAYILFSTGLKRIPSSSAVTLSLAEPLTAAILSVLVVGEVLDKNILGWYCHVAWRNPCIDAEWP